jgi:hypothetical protein
MKVEGLAGRKLHSPWREPWEESERNQPRNGAKEPFCFARPALERFSFAPFRGWAIRCQVPSADALGYYLAPLPGFASAAQRLPPKIAGPAATRAASTFMSCTPPVTPASLHLRKRSIDGWEGSPRRS